MFAREGSYGKRKLSTSYDVLWSLADARDPITQDLSKCISNTSKLKALNLKLRKKVLDQEYSVLPAKKVNS